MESGSDQGLLTRGSPNVLTGSPRLLFFTQAVRLLRRRPPQPPDMGDGTPRKYGENDLWRRYSADYEDEREDHHPSAIDQ
ncbi:unnamed protein product, partial [Musa hybrid cultivar]